MRKTLGGVKTSQIICTGLTAKKHLVSWFFLPIFSLFSQQEETSKRFEEWMAFLASCQLARCGQRYTYRVLQTIQMKLILLYVWAEPAVLGSTETALKFKYEIQIG